MPRTKLDPWRVTGADEHAVTDVLLTLENDGRFREQVWWLRSRLAKRVGKDYTPTLAARAWRWTAEHYLTLYYYREHCSGGFRFDLPTRNAMGKALEASQREYVFGEAGIPADMVPSFTDDTPDTAPTLGGDRA